MEYLWTEWRAAMLASAATERDIAQSAAIILCRLGNLAPERWLEQTELIVRHLICTDIEGRSHAKYGIVFVFPEVDRVY